MKTFASLTSQGRLYAVLFSSAVLASGCGGNVDTPGNGPATASEIRVVPAQTASNMALAPVAPATASAPVGATLPGGSTVPDDTAAVAEAAHQAESGAAATADTSAQFPAPAANFEVHGYQSSDAGTPAPE